MKALWILLLFALFSLGYIVGVQEKQKDQAIATLELQVKE